MNGANHLGLVSLFVLLGFTSLRADDALPGPRNQFNDYCYACLYYDQGVAQVTTDPAEAEKALSLAQKYDVLAVREGLKKQGIELGRLIAQALKIAQANIKTPAPTPATTPAQNQTAVSQINSVKLASPVIKPAIPPTSQNKKRSGF